jgi:hypothetical protein
MTVNFSSVKDGVKVNRKPICSEFHPPRISQLLPSGVELHCFVAFISSNSSRISSRIEMTFANSLDLLFVTAFELAAGLSSNVLFMKVFDKSLSAALLLLICSLLLIAVAALAEFAIGGNKQSNIYFIFGRKTKQ